MCILNLCRWLLMKGRDDEAKTVLARIYPDLKGDENKEALAFIKLRKSILGEEQTLKSYTWKKQLQELSSWRIAQRYSYYYVVLKVLIMMFLMMKLQGYDRSCDCYAISNLWKLHAVCMLIYYTA